MYYCLLGEDKYNMLHVQVYAIYHMFLSWISWSYIYFIYNYWNLET